MSEPSPPASQPSAAGADPTPFRYTAELASTIEARWQDHWESEETFAAPNPSGPLAGDGAQKPAFYVLDMFPYPSGAGLHVGHPLGYIGTDVLGRYRRMCGDNVLHALGYDAFGLPAEQYAVQTGQHPRVTTEANIATMRRQLRRLGLAHDARRSVATTDVDFYRWTQWIFLQVYNSWFDPEATAPDGSAGRARPISELEAQFRDGGRDVPGGRGWAELSPSEQAAVLDEHRLAYLSHAPVNWCPGLGTVLANEEVTVEGRSERGNFPVFQRDLSQWMMRITSYADRLLADLDKLDWPDSIKLMQRNWIGRSTGAMVRFDVQATSAGSAGSEAAGDASHGASVEVFTTRPDTLFGATFMVLAPEHPMLAEFVGQEWPDDIPADQHERWTGGHESPRAAVAAYRLAAEQTSEEDRIGDAREKTGVFTGVYATNPVNGQPLPVFVADYVLMGYGTGAIMAVPAEDERDWAFAAAYGLPHVRTVQPPADFDGGAYTGDGPTINSANDEISLDGMDVEQAKQAITDWLAAKGSGESAVQFKLRDWLFSRQRYWGEPFPIVYPTEGERAGMPVALPEDLLPLELPEVSDYSPRTFDAEDAETDPEPPLARAEDWVHVELDLGDGPRRYRRETNTMPQWAGSCWYEIRYLDPTNDASFVDSDVERYWMGPRDAHDVGGVDLYVGGVEHAVLHLLYARFWHKVLFDLGHVSSGEPFRRLFNQGYIQAYAYTDARGSYVPAEEVLEDGESATGYRWQDQDVTREYGKMGKSLKNSVTPDDMCREYGADTLRLYEMSMGPLDASRPWETRAVVGSFRFLQRVWRNVVDEGTGEVRVSEGSLDDATARALHRTIATVREDVEALRFNTAIARLIELNNHLTKLDAVPREAAETLVLMLSPFAPHVAEELWSRLGHESTLAYEPFPTADESLLTEDMVTCVVQVAGKVRDKMEVPVSIDEDELRERALATAGVRRTLGDRPIRTVVVRAPRLVNVVPG